MRGTGVVLQRERAGGEENNCCQVNARPRDQSRLGQLCLASTELSRENVTSHIGSDYVAVLCFT
jgi:hypothetical protein